MYNIKIEYETGNSFNTFTETDIIEHDWLDISMAKKSLERIANHYKFNREHPCIYKKPDVDLPQGVIWDDEYRKVGLELIDNNGTFRTYPFWTGYFEKLYKAEIVIVADVDMIFEPYGC